MSALFDGSVESRLERLATLIAESPHALVSRGDRALVAAIHIPECRAIHDEGPWRSGERWLDLGTGGGLPGLVLAILAPSIDWVLVDATRKKAAAVQEFIRELALDNATARWGRAEALARDPGWRATFDGVVSRALAPLAASAELSRGFVRGGGEIVCVKGAAATTEASAVEGAIWQRLTVRPPRFAPVSAAPRPTTLVLLHCVGPPPGWVPRREGQPQHSPLA